jgi:hypothetical protein
MTDPPEGPDREALRAVDDDTLPCDECGADVTEDCRDDCPTVNPPEVAAARAAIADLLPTPPAPGPEIAHCTRHESFTAGCPWCATARAELRRATATYTPPAPAEGPDREALRRHRAASYAIREVYRVVTANSGMTADRADAFADEAADAVLALLPTPPASGDEPERCARHGMVDCACVKVPAPGGDPLSVADWNNALPGDDDSDPEPAPISGEGLRGEVAAAVWTQNRVLAAEVDRLRAALAARDTDQGARDAQLRANLAATDDWLRTVDADHKARIEGLRTVLDETVTALDQVITQAERWQNDGKPMVMPRAASQRAKDALRTSDPVRNYPPAALAARDTDQGAGAGVLPLCPVCREPVELWADLHGEAQADCTACDWQTEVAL